MRKKDDAKQNSIKRAVVQIVLNEGMHGASISKIARAAGVSPATVYIYYENKDVMLRDIYHEYAEEIFSTLTRLVSDDMTAETFIRTVIQAYDRLISQHQEVYHFVEQFSTCPSLSQGCMALKGPEVLDSLITAYKKQGAIRNYDNTNIWAMIFYPVKGLAGQSCVEDSIHNKQLNEMIEIVQKALLT